MSHRFMPSPSVLVLLAVMHGVGVADDPQEKPPAQIGLGGALPLRDEIAEVILSDGSLTRSISLHREDRSAQRGLENYYHRPLWAFVTRPEPKRGVPDPYAGYPEIIRRVRADESFVYFTLTLQTTSPAFRVRAAERVKSDDQKYWAAQQPILQPVVRRWPLKMVYARAELADSHEVLATGRTAALTEDVDYIDIPLAVPARNLPRFLSEVASGNLTFIFSYQWSNRVTAQATKRRLATKTVIMEAQSALSSQQRAGAVPITQMDVERVLRRVTAVDQTEIAADHPDMVVLLQSQPTDLAGRIFDPTGDMTLDDVRSKNPEIDAQLAAYLRPLLETALISEQHQSTVTEIHEDNDATKSGAGMAVGIPIGPIFLGVDAHTEGFKSVIDRLQRSSGVSFQQVAQTERWKPHSLKIFKVRSGDDVKSTDEAVIASVAIGSNDSYTESSPVPACYTAAWVAKQLGMQEQLAVRASYDAMPVGAMIHYLGKDPKLLAPTFLPCDGTERRTSEFPQLAQLLNGEGYRAETFALPDLRGRFLRGMDPEGLRDPLGRSRAVGSAEDDTFQSHGHVELGEHRHLVMCYGPNEVRLTEGFWYWNGSTLGSNPDGSGGLKLLLNDVRNFIPLPYATNAAPNWWPTPLNDGRTGYRFLCFEQDIGAQSEGKTLLKAARAKLTSKNADGKEIPVLPEEQARVSVRDVLPESDARAATETTPKNLASWIMIRAR